MNESFVCHRAEKFEIKKAFLKTKIGRLNQQIRYTLWGGETKLGTKLKYLKRT